MTPSQQCKQAGLESLADLLRLTPVPKRTLLDWFKHKPEHFKMAIDAALYKSDHLTKQNSL